MLSVDNVESLAFVCAPYLYNDLCFVYPLSVGKVLTLQEKYSLYVQILTIDRTYIIRLLQSKDKQLAPGEIPKPFDFLMKSCLLDRTFLLELKEAFRTFIQEDITILPEIGQIVIGNPTEKRILNEENFLEFQNILRLQNKISTVEEIPENETERARYFREKRELRDAIKRKQEGSKAQGLTDLMSALCVYGIGITPLNIKNISIFSLYSLLKVSSSRERYQCEMEFLWGGADPKKLKPKYWINDEK